jgi:hypothetical protein
MLLFSTLALIAVATTIGGSVKVSTAAITVYIYIYKYIYL